MLHSFHETVYMQTIIYSKLLHWYVSICQYLYTNILQIILERTFYPYLRQCHIFLIKHDPLVHSPLMVTRVSRNMLEYLLY